MQVSARGRITIALFTALFLNAVLWAGSRSMYAQWAGVPPVPSETGAVTAALGDREFAYRSGALSLQHLGDGGGRTTPLSQYDYGKVGGWLSLLHALNPASEHAAFMAAFYFGAVRDPEKVAVIVDHLARIGQNPVGEKWRWLAEAAFLARHRMGNLDRALDIAYTLARMQPLSGPLPPWAREMPALILEAKGETETARRIIESILLTERDLPPQEVNFLRAYLIERLGVPAAEVEALITVRVP